VPLQHSAAMIYKIQSIIPSFSSNQPMKIQYKNYGTLRLGLQKQKLEAFKTKIFKLKRNLLSGKQKITH
jgi:hypothetical protein